jgi:hypothetical protein
MALGIPFLIGSAIAGTAGSIAQAGAASKLAGAKTDAANKAEKATDAFVNRQLRQLGGLEDRERDLLSNAENFFRRSQNALNFVDDAEETLGGLFETQTRQQRENLDFILGGTDDQLRATQQENLDLAQGNFSGFLDSLRSSTLGALATTEGRPVGAFENLSARNQLAARSRGLSNFLSISDFFGREGTVDPPSALNVFGAATGLSEFEAREDAEETAFGLELLDRNLALEEGLFGRQFDINRIGLIAEVEALNAIANVAGTGQFGLGSALQGIGQGFGAIGQIQGFAESSRQNQATQARINQLLDLQIQKAQSS